MRAAGGLQPPLPLAALLHPEAHPAPPPAPPLPPAPPAGCHPLAVPRHFAASGWRGAAGGLGPGGGGRARRSLLGPCVWGMGFGLGDRGEGLGVGDAHGRRAAWQCTAMRPVSQHRYRANLEQIQISQSRPDPGLS